MRIFLSSDPAEDPNFEFFVNSVDVTEDGEETTYDLTDDMTLKDLKDFVKQVADPDNQNFLAYGYTNDWYGQEGYIVMDQTGNIEWTDNQSDEDDEIDAFWKD